MKTSEPMRWSGVPLAGRRVSAKVTVPAFGSRAAVQGTFSVVHWNPSSASAGWRHGPHDRVDAGVPESAA
ncbi:MAG: hypothetical protein U0R65_02610 [Candidatus Nanopelagicales bacterium]